MKSFILVVITVTLFYLSDCQIAYGQFVPYTHYEVTGVMTNPAAPVLSDFSQVTAHYRRSRVGGYDIGSASFQHPFYRRSNLLRSGGIGANMISQQAGPGGIYSVFGLTGAAAYMAHLSTQHHLGLGISGGVVNKRLDLSRITTDSQYNLGMYDPSLQTGENFQSASEIKPVLNVGLCWLLTNKSGVQKASIGLAGYNVNRPSFDFFPKAPADYISYVVMGEFTLFSSGPVSLSPTFRYIYQATSTANIGTRVNYAFASNQSLAVNAWYKTTKALAFAVQCNYKSYCLGAASDLSLMSGAYDANVSNAIEVFVGWRLNRKELLKKKAESSLKKDAESTLVK